MKLRIKGNSIRIRLSKTEVDLLAKNGQIEENTRFLNNTLGYVLQSKDGITGLQADYSDSKLTMYIPGTYLITWPDNDVVGFENNMQLPGNEQLHLLLEKDFKCKDTSEDQSDNYDNPNPNC